MRGILDRRAFDSFFDNRSKEIATALGDFIRIPTVTPFEADCFDFVRQYLAGLEATVETRTRHPGLDGHLDLSPHPAARTQGGPNSLFATFGNGADAAVTTRFNAHLDVVPASPEDPAAFEPRVDERAIWGRGACDTKGNLVMLVEAIRFLESQSLESAKRLELDLPCEEEIGGNGTLSNILYGGKVDEAVCLEPTDLAVYRGHRGCLTFAIDFVGRSVHMGEAASGVSAIDGAIILIAQLRELEAVLVEEARRHPAFSVWQWPLGLNIGMIDGGEWSGTVPERCRVVGDLGFMPTAPLAHVERSLRDACRRGAEGWPRGQWSISFDQGLRNDAYLCDASAPVVREWAELVGKGAEEVAGWNVSCDARHYANVGIPTVVFGSGSLKDAHSAHEHVTWAQLREGAWMLARYMTTERSSP